MILQIIPVINKIFMTGFCPFPSLTKFWSRTAYDTLSVLALKMWNKQHRYMQIHISKVTKVYS